MVRQVKLRNRNYWAWFAKEPVGNTHGHWSEYVMHATAIACNVTFVMGLQVCGVQLESLREIAQLARLAHFWQVFPVLDRLGVRVAHAFQSLQRRAAPPSRSLYVAAFALCPQGDTPPELGEYFWLMFPRFYFGLSETERTPFARYAGAMLERFLRRAQNKEDLREVALALHRLHFSNNT
ncbi:unnamed protein product [Pelagomonas calceolata]|uniref:Uncharacterized protein n=1 Tax=Pelagomonas calceolata TaxID=35677 RepID=A0A8J2WTU5_9STRA|nr:unnamed protein product [Pelagomonas calceolata]